MMKRLFSLLRQSVSARAIVSLVSLAALLTGFTVLVGWRFHLPILKSVFPQRQLPEMLPLTAVGIFLAGLALGLQRNRQQSRWRHLVALACAGSVALIGLLMFCEHVFSWRFDLVYFSTFLFPGEARREDYRQPSFHTAVELCLLGTALLVLDWRPRRIPQPAQLLALAALHIAALLLLGYTVGNPNSYTMGSADAGIALHTTILALLLSLGILCARPDWGFTAIMLSRGGGGVVARRLVFAPLGVPLLLVFAAIAGKYAGIRQEFIGWLFLSSLFIVATLIIWWVADIIERADAHIRTLNLDLERRVAERTAELAEANRDLLASQNRVRLALAAARMVAWEWQLASGAVTLSENASEVLGLPAGTTTLAADELTARIHAEDRSKNQAIIIRGIEQQKSYVSQFRFIRPGDGTVIWLEGWAHVVREENGKGDRLVGVYLDITERKRVEEANVRYNDRLKILQQIDRAMLAGDDPTAVAATVLPLVRDLLGVSRAIVNLFDLAAEEVEWLGAAGRRRVRVGPGVRYSIKFMGDVEALRRGEPQWIDVHKMPPGPEVDALLASGIETYVAVPMIAGGELIGALSFGGTEEPISPEQVSMAEDVSRQFALAIMQARLHERVKRQAQELEIRVRERTRELEAAHAELQQTHSEMVALTAELQAANKELEAFTYSVSHDLRAPLRGIAGFSRMLQEDFGSQMPAEGQEYLKEVQDCAREMGLLVDDLLAFSRLSRQPLRTQVVHPTTLVRDCLDDLRVEKNGRNIDIAVADLEPCQGDAALLKQVWINLLSNALKYTGKKECARIEIGSSKSADKKVTYFVRDNGVGFDMRYVHKLFGVFQRLHRAEDYEGTGVGLATVQRIIHRHGGRVWAEARPNEGATFFFTLQGSES